MNNDNKEFYELETLIKRALDILDENGKEADKIEIIIDNSIGHLDLINQKIEKFQCLYYLLTVLRNNPGAFDLECSRVFMRVRDIHHDLLKPENLSLKNQRLLYKKKSKRNFDSRNSILRSVRQGLKGSISNEFIKGLEFSMS